MTGNCKYGLTVEEHDVSIDAAVAALTAAAFPAQPKGCDHCDHVCDAGEPTIHTMTRSMIGADWTLASAVAFVRSAQDVRWVHGLAGHDLGALTDENLAVYFNVQHPGKAL